MSSKQRNNNPRKRQNKNKQSKQMAPLLKSFPSQVVAEIKVPGLSFPLVTTAITGVIAGLYQVGGNSILNFTARFGALFKEYRIVGIKIKVNRYSSTNSGLFSMWVDNISSAAPNSTEAQTRTQRQFSCAGPSSESLKWLNHDPNDLDYLSTAVTTAISFFKIYTDGANFGADTAVVQYGNVSSVFYIQFRDLL